MSYKLPGPKTLGVLERGIPLFRNGLRYEQDRQQAEQRGHRSGSQIVISRAKGDFIWDMDDNRFIDFQNGWATNPVGNAHPEVIEAVHKAHQQYGFHYDHPLRYELAEKLLPTMPHPSLNRFNYEVSGTEAAESAIHLALTHTKRRYIIVFSSAFHGESLAGKVLSGFQTRDTYMEAWNGGVIRAPYPYSEQIPAGMSREQYVDYCLWYLEHQIPNSVASKKNIAGVIVEPGLAEGGNWIPSVEFLQGIRRICDKHDWLMIADEVLTGLGRTGKMWAVEHYQVKPDILVVGKNLSGGIEPCAGIAARDDILGANNDFASGSTFAGTPAGCAAGLKTLELYERYNLVENAAYLGRVASNFMTPWEEKYEIVSQVRSNGLLIGVNFRSPDPNMDDWWFSRSVRSRMLANGVWAISDRENTIRLYPALNMNESVLREGLQIMEEAIDYVNRHGSIEGNSPAWPTGVAGF
ncbi:aspartate aminotransferase family protein [Parendozoicomonas haliclonae]|uniref:4-aminobutyrate aminotransferase GabT n=1 Tax=Parendozoicomonas haliclonae TaxID=1960125 RepID=A0A1X7AP31_9GAMM|nr:aspartate aminotransferase family protein [Parendozoicomonas haliclonae]SMA49850.1 4-aminobutyrate aminotransferase GabT [Parendozoicomonas haliclonae]